MPLTVPQRELLKAIEAGDSKVIRAALTKTRNSLLRRGYVSRLGTLTRAGKQALNRSRTALNKGKAPKLAEADLIAQQIAHAIEAELYIEERLWRVIAERAHIPIPESLILYWIGALFE